MNIISLNLFFFYFYLLSDMILNILLILYNREKHFFVQIYLTPASRIKIFIIFEDCKHFDRLSYFVLQESNSIKSIILCWLNLFLLIMYAIFCVFVCNLISTGMFFKY